MSVLDSVDRLCPVQLLALTEDVIRGGIQQYPDLYHHVVDALCVRPKSHQAATQIIYILRNYGYNINYVNENGSAPLLQYLQSCDLMNEDFVEAILRCNSDVFLKNEDNTCAFEEARKPEVSRSIKELFARYMPGIWKAVAADDVHQVRFLVNQWCRVDVEQDGQTLLHLSFDVGTENIIGIISGIRNSMLLAHSVMAGDVRFVAKLLNEGHSVNVNLKNLGDGGTTPLYYAALQNNTEIVQLLLARGARVHCTMTTGDRSDLPMLFGVMLDYPLVTAFTLELLIPQTPVHVETLHYQGKNILFHCVDCDMDPSVVTAILDVSSAAMVTAREEHGLTAREYAVLEGCDAVVEVIDKFVYTWWTDKMCDKNRKLLALHSYHPLPPVCQYPPLDGPCNQDNDNNDIYEDSVSDSLHQYQHHICKFHQALEVEDEESVHTDITYFGCDDLQEFMCDSRPQGDGQPALHKVVLRRNVRLTHLLAETLVYKQGCRLDSVRDQFFRTALHYAYALEDNKAILNVLVDHGASDFTMDKDGRSPLAFKDRRDLGEMKNLLHYQLIQDFDQPEPDPWSLPLPIPIVGYMRNCRHTHHRHNNVGQRLNSGDNRNRQILPASTGIVGRWTVTLRDKPGTKYRITESPKVGKELQTLKSVDPLVPKVKMQSSDKNSSCVMFSDFESDYIESSDSERPKIEFDNSASDCVLNNEDSDESSEYDEYLEEEFEDSARHGSNTSRLLCTIL